MAIPSIRLCVRLSHACFTKRMKVSSKFFHCLIYPSILFSTAKLLRKSDGFTPNGCAEYRGAIFDQYAAISRKRYRGIFTMEDEYKVACALSKSPAFGDLQ